MCTLIFPRAPPASVCRHFPANHAAMENLFPIFFGLLLLAQCSPATANNASSAHYIGDRNGDLVIEPANDATVLLNAEQILFNGKDVLSELAELRRQVSQSMATTTKTTTTTTTTTTSNCQDGGPTVKTLTGHQKEAASVALDSGVIVSGARDNTIKVWDRTNNYNLITTLTGHTNVVISVALDAGVIVSVSLDKTIKVWDLSLIHI